MQNDSVHNERVFVDRRKGPDFWVKWVRRVGIIVWIIVIAIIFIIDKAKPPLESFLDRMFNIQLRKTWDDSLMFYAFCLLLFLFLLCAFTMVINIYRHRRKTDRFNPTVIFFGITSMIGIIIFMILTW